MREFLIPESLEIHHFVVILCLDGKNESGRENATGGGKYGI